MQGMNNHLVKHMLDDASNYGSALDDSSRNSDFLIGAALFFAGVATGAAALAPQKEKQHAQS